MVQFFGLAAGVVSIIGYIPYIRDVLKSKTRPDRASWLIWTAQYSVLFATQVAHGATHSLWLVAMQLVGIIAVAMLSIKYGIGRIGRNNALLLASVGMGLVLWYILNDAAIALFIALAIEWVGVILTAVKAYKYPGTETVLFWALTGTAGIFGALAVGPTTNYILFAYPVALVLMCATIILACILGERKSNPEVSMAVSDTIAS